MKGCVENAKTIILHSEKSESNAIRNNSIFSQPISSRSKVIYCPGASDLRTIKIVSKVGILAAIIAIALGLAAKNYPDAVEKYFARGLYPVLASSLAAVSNRLPFSMMAVSFLLPILAIGVGAVAGFVLELRKTRSKMAAFGGGILAAIGTSGWAYALFSLLWGLNYHRKSAPDIFNAPFSITIQEEMQALASAAAKTNQIRADLHLAPNSCVSNPISLSMVDGPMQDSQEGLFAAYSLPAYGRGPSKEAPLGSLMLSMGATGIYSPFSAEHNVAWPGPPGWAAFTAAHERAHFAGFASEDAANFVAFLTAWRSPNRTVSYSGWLAFWRYVSPPEGLLSADVRRDLLCVDRFIHEHRTKGAVIGGQIYGGYLKSQGVTSGRGSYRIGSLQALSYLTRNKQLMDLHD